MCPHLQEHKQLVRCSWKNQSSGALLKPFTALNKRQTTLSPLNRMLEGNKTQPHASPSISACMKAVDTSDAINQRSHKDANATTHRNESNEEVGAYVPDRKALSAPDAKSLMTSRHLANVGVF